MIFQLYRHYDGNGILLYVGQALNAVSRLATHKTKASWFLSIEKIEIERFDSKEKVIEAEKKAIEAERPLFNKRTGKTPYAEKFNPENKGFDSSLDAMRKHLAALNTNQRQLLAQRANVGVATIHRIATVPCYFPSTRTVTKIASEL